MSTCQHTFLNKTKKNTKGELCGKPIRSQSQFCYRHKNNISNNIINNEVEIENERKNQFIQLQNS